MVVMRMLMRLLLIGFAVVALAVPAFAQSDEEEAVVLPDGVMRQVVARIVKGHIKLGRRATTVYFSDLNLRRRWLPKIRGVRFVIVDGNQYRSGLRGYTISEVVRSGDKRGYTIGFGYGEIGCGGAGGRGTIWEIRVVRSRVRFLPARGSWQWNCDENSVESSSSLCPPELERWPFDDGWEAAASFIPD